MPFEIRPDPTTGETTIAINAVDLFKLTAAGDLVLLKSAAKVIGGVPLLPAGAFQFFQLPTAPPGWIAGDGTTIGSAASGATRANADTLDLFTAWWAYTDAQLPILTSAGLASTRGASAAADWLAGKRLTVFDARGRFPRAAGTINSLVFTNGTKYADVFRSHNHGIGGDNVFGTAGTFSYYQGQNRATGLSESVGGGETAPVSLAMLGCYKL